MARDIYLQASKECTYASIELDKASALLVEAQKRHTMAEEA